jgi:hypothetical protein
MPVGRPFLAVCLVLGVVAAVGFYVSRAPNVEDARAASGAISAPSNAPNATATPPQVSLTTSTSSDEDSLSSSGRLAQQASRSTNLRSFVEYAKQRPQEGGVTYAVAALQYCQYFSQLISKYPSLSAEVSKSPGPTAALRLEALNRMSSQCADFTPQELGQDLTLRASGRSTDPILKLQMQWFDYRKLSPEAQRELITSTLAARDPYLFNAIGSTINQKVVDGQVIVAFDGQRFGGLASEADYRAAWSLVACNFGEDCAISSDITALCVFEGQCFSSRENLLRAQFDGRKSDFDRVVALSRRLTDAVRSGAAERFLMPVSER